MADRRGAIRRNPKEQLNNDQEPIEPDDSDAAKTTDRLELFSNSEDNEKEEPSNVSRMQTDDDTSASVDNLQDQSEHLVTTLANKRRRVKNEVIKETENRIVEDSATEMLRVAQERMGKKLKVDLSSNVTDVASQKDEAEELVPPVDTFNEDASSAPPTSRSGLSPRRAGINTALRAKLAEKLKAAKDKGKDEAYSETIGKIHKLAGLRNEQHRRTRFDETSLMKDEEEADEDDEIERSLQLKMKTLSTIQSSMQRDGKADLVTDEETIEFFTRVWERSEKDFKQEPDEVEPGEDQKDEVSDHQTVKDLEKRKLERKEEDEIPLLEAEDECSWLPYQIASPEYIPGSERLVKERDMFFVPSMFEAPLQQRTFTQTSPRHLADEGFYVGIRPFVPTRNLNRMENRLLKEVSGRQLMDEEASKLYQWNSSKKWFGEDGRLITLPDPVKEISSRPPIVDEVESQFAARYHEAELPESTILAVGRHQLDIDLNTVVFTHHHLFSQEHVLAAELTRLYQEYVLRMKKQPVEYLSGKLHALKSAQCHVEDNMRRIKTDSSIDSDTAYAYQEQRRKEYVEEIRLTRKQRDFEMQSDRTLVKNVIRIWKDIKILRQNHRCSNTSIKLIVKKEEANQIDDEKEWKEEIEEEMMEIQDELETQHLKDMEIYKSQLNLWKTQKLKKKEANKRKTQLERQQNRIDEFRDQIELEEEILNEPDIEKPMKPTLLTAAEVKQRIEAKYDEIKRKPGESKLYLDLANFTPVTSMDECPREEQQRRNDVNRCKIFVRILFNNKEVSKTDAKPIGQEFIIRFAQIFNVEIMHWPESIKLEIYETYGLGTDLLSTIYVAIPDANLTVANSQLMEYNFSSDKKRIHSHSGIGSGVVMQTGNTSKTISNLTTSGYVTASVAWATDFHRNALISMTQTNKSSMFRAMKGTDVITAIGLSGLSDMSKLTKWVEDSHLDPNDPTNADIIHLMKPINEGSGGVAAFQMPQQFRLEHVQEEFNFATDEDIENNRRFRLICLREQDIPGFKHQRIPAYENEIRDEIFAMYEKNIKEEERMKNADDADSHHLKVSKYMQKIREQILMRFHIATHQKTFADMIYEEAVPNIGIILPSLLKLTEPRRPLKPPRKPRKTVTAQNLQAAEVKILVNIVRAVGIPIRAESYNSYRNQGNKSNRPASPEEPPASRTSRKTDLQSLVRPFIEIMFQHNVLATSVADGPNPSWNEELCIPFRPPQDDYSATNLQMVKDVLYLNIFDEYVVDVNQDARDHGSLIHQRIERRWLGSIQVPFSTIYANGRIDGTFRIDRPAVLLGYVKDSYGTPPIDVGSDVLLGESEHTYLTMFLTIEPQLVPPEPTVEKFQSLESDDFLLAAKNWKTDLEKKFPKRDFKPTVINFEAKSLFVMRYIKPLNPPQDLLTGELSSLNVARNVARYVSLIPSVSDAVIFPGLCDIWSTSSQFLQMLQGDEEEHAVLLTNYFLFLGRNAWLVIGSAIPEGPTAYVLTREQNDFFLWNASTGEHFNSHDNYCPLQNVGCLVNADNIWGNIQPNDKPCQMSFNTSNTSHWKPLFHKGFTNPGLGSVQVEHLTYLKPNMANISKLQEKIEAELKKKIAEWRPHYITRWNRLCIQTFRRLLIQLEEMQGKGLQQEHLSELEQVAGSYKLCGFPINLSYTEMKSITDSVYATGVHEFASSDVEFALAVHIQPYPNHVLSVWIYVASLVRIHS